MVDPRHPHRRRKCECVPKVGRPGIEDLAMPPKRYRPSKCLEDFPTAKAAERELRTRVRLLAETTHQGLWGDAARTLSERLAADEETLANNKVMLAWQDRIVGQLYRLIEHQAHQDVCTFTIAKMVWAKHPVELDVAVLEAIERQVRKNVADLKRKLSPRHGWIFATIEASYDVKLVCYQFHLHGTASGDYIGIIDGLKRLRSYKPWKNIPGIPDCKHPVRRSREPLTKMPSPINYAFKSFWKVRKGGRVVRLPGDEHTRMLMFLDQCKVKDLTILINLGIENGALKELGTQY